MKTLMLATSLLLLGTSAARAQVFVQGTVVNTDSMRLPGARVRIVDRAGAFPHEAITDSLGEFTIRIARPLPAGQFTLRSELIGYQTLTTPLSLEDLNEIEITITMDVSAVPLEPLRVAARRRYTRGPRDDYYDRADRVRRFGGGTIIDESELKHRAGSTVNMIVAERVPTVRSCPPAYFIDGMRATMEDLRMTYAASVQGIEVYRSTTLAPPQYQSRGGCGVVLIWTQIGDRGQGTRLTLRRVLMTIGLIGAGVVLLR